MDLLGPEDVISVDLNSDIINNSIMLATKVLDRTVHESQVSITLTLTYVTCDTCVACDCDTCNMLHIQVSDM